MNRNINRTFPLFAALALLACASAGAQQDGVYVDIAPCLDMRSDAERNACYVTRAEELRATLAASAPASATTLAPAPAPAPAAAMADFGREAPAAAVRREARARILANTDGTEELIATIAALDQRMPNMWDVTLSNGQVWRQINSEKYRLREGMEARIYPSAFAGSFRLSAKGVNGFIQVRRVR